MSLTIKIDTIFQKCGGSSRVIIRKISIGRETPVEAAIIYITGLVDQNIINRDILNPLLFQIKENLYGIKQINNYICSKYISMSDIIIENDVNNVVKEIKRGRTAIVIDTADNYIIANTADGEHRSISEPKDEQGVRGSREGFIENLEINISLLRRGIKDNNLVIENYIIGRRSQKDLAMVYIDDIVDKDLLEDIKARIQAIDVDAVTSAGMVEQFIEDYPYTVFPQVYTTQRPDIVQQNLMEGRIAIMLDGTPFVLTVPALLVEFFQAVEDYSQRTVVTNFNRFIRILGTIMVITIPSIYLSLVRFNAELIPIKFVLPLIQSRKDIALSPFLEILSMDIVIEFLREGGLRLPGKISPIISIVGGFIIGSAALQAHLVSPDTLVVVGVATIGTFIIPNYDMASSVRLLRFPLLFLTNFLGAFGLIAGLYLLSVHVLSLDSFGVPYFTLDKYGDLKDTLVRTPLWKMNKRPEGIPNSNPVRQSDFRRKFWRNKNEKNKK